MFTLIKLNVIFNIVKGGAVDDYRSYTRVDDKLRR